jgi:serine/threonine protein kinase
MNAERWQAIGELFEQALPLPAGERTALLDDACGVDAELRHEVVSLLASHNAGGGFLQHRIEKALASFHDTSVAGTQPVRVGPYRLIRELGRGGMGTVFLAERDDDEYYAQVAVKLVRPGMDIDFILARFRRERQTLARLQHPNISRLLDGGTTENGLPYFVMEYIDGPWLTAFAADRRMPVDDRLRMFLDVCSAVDYAHRNFIIHRDLKPGNILVDPDGVPKLVDFGICKLLRAGAISATDSAVAPMTPDYASPEQMRGDAVTPLSDIYSLGAVLYELLTGTCPRRYARLTRVAIEQMSQAGIALPSTVAGDQAVARQLKGDLDSILMRALETEPEPAIRGGRAVRDDLRRYLHHEPVQARPQTVRYRAVKFVRRHRGHVAAAAAVFVALSIGLAVSVHEARVASSRQQQVRMMADKLVFDVHDAVRDLPGSTRARAVIVQTATPLPRCLRQLRPGRRPSPRKSSRRRTGARDVQEPAGRQSRRTPPARWLDIATGHHAARRRRAPARQAMSNAGRRNGWCCTTVSERSTPSRGSCVTPCRHWRTASASAAPTRKPATPTCGWRWLRCTSTAVTRDGI